MKFIQYKVQHNYLQIIMMWYPFLTNSIKIMSNPLFLKFRVAISTQKQRLASSKNNDIYRFNKKSADFALVASQKERRLVNKIVF